MTTASADRTSLDVRELRAPAVEIGVQLLLIAGAALLVALLQGHELPERALGTLTFAAGVAATILLVVGAWMGGSAQARRIAAAVGVYTGVALLLRAVDVDGRGGLWSLGAGVAVLGVGGLLLTAVAPRAPGQRRTAVALLVLVAGGVATVVLAGILVPGHAPPVAAVVAVEVAGWAAAGAAGLVLVAAGFVQDRPLARRVGLAFAALGGAHALGTLTARVQVAGVLELAAASMLLVAAVPFLVGAVRLVGRQQEASRASVAQAEAVMAAVAERDHELRNVVAGLSGAAIVLRDEESGRSGEARQLLLAAGAELGRLQAMLDGGGASGGEAEVGPLLHDLAAVHRAAGLDVAVDVAGDPCVATGADVVAQVLTNLLVNCARHAPGARVVLRAGVQGRQVRIEVADDGPGVAPGDASAVLRRGVRGPASTGSGLGLSITSELVERHRGSLALSSGPRGCTVVVHLPTAGRSASRAPVDA